MGTDSKSWAEKFVAELTVEGERVPFERVLAINPDFAGARLDMAEFQQTQAARLDADALPIQAQRLDRLAKSVIPFDGILRVRKDLQLIRKRDNLLPFQLGQHDRRILVFGE